MKSLPVPPLTRVLVIALLISTLAVSFIRFRAFSEFNGTPKGETPANPEAPGKEELSIPIHQIYVPFLTLVPAFSIVYPWTLVTSAFVEQNIFGFFVTGATLLFCGRYCERIWGSRALGKFILIQSSITNALTVVSIWTLNLFVSSDYELLGSRINGGIPFQLGFLVALKQLVPEHSVVLFQGVVKIQVKYLVMPVLLLYTLLGVVESITLLLMAWYGFLTAWVYFRFVKVVYIEALPMSLTEGSNQQKVRGDASDAFALERFFYPEPVSRAVGFITNPVYNVLVKTKIIRPFNQDEIDASNDQASLRTQGFLNGNQQRMAQAISDRRRNMALKALEERMQS